MADGDHAHLVIGTQPLDQVVEERDDAPAAGWVDASWDNEHDPHGAQSGRSPGRSPGRPPTAVRRAPVATARRSIGHRRVTTIRSIITERRAHQRLFVDHAVDRLRGGSGPMPALELADLQFAGLATGLTALVAHLTDNGSTAGVADQSVTMWLTEQRDEVSRRVAKFGELVPYVRGLLAAADVPAVPVKGAELAAAATSVWGIPSARPMADVDLVVPRRYRAQAAATMVSAGFRPDGSTSFEDVFLAWGDGSVGRTDGESALHNGRVELHPDWTEFLHGYVACGFDVESYAVADPELRGGFRLDLPALTAHVIGHLSSTVVRAEVRAVNAVDVWWCHQAGVDWDRVATCCREIDPRLTAPGLWLAHAVVPDAVPVRLLAREFDRLPRAARRAIDAVAPEAVFRDPASRTSASWRQAFANGRERVSVLDQMAFPSGVRTVRSLASRASRASRLTARTPG